MLRRLSLAGLVVVAACEPQIVDAVDSVRGGATAGAAAAAGGAGTGNGNGGAGNVGNMGDLAGAGGAPCTGADCCDSSGDRDGDGVPDCDDGCPDQPLKTKPGLCGCELPDDAADAGVASCTGLIASLVHRYAFNGAGTAVHDSEGGPDGVVVDAALAGNGTVSLAGRMTDQYVDLPNGIVSVLESATFEAWLTWYGGYEWQRIFDFGDDDTGVEDSRGTGFSYLFLTPRITDDGGAVVRVAYRRDTATEEVHTDATRTLPTGKLTHVAVTVDAPTATLALYIDGALERAEVITLVPLELAALHDINNWLGRSQYSADPELGATFEEFRIYSRALDAAELRASFAAGPNPSFLDSTH